MMTNQIPVHGGEHEQRQLSEQRDDDGALPHMHERIVREVGLTQKLKCRATQNKREILGVPQGIGAGTGCPRSH